MKNILKNGLYKYFLIGIISVLISGATLLANEKQAEKEITIDQNAVSLEKELDEMNAVVQELQEEIQKMKDHINDLESAQRQTYIITKDAPVFEKTSSLSKQLGTFPVNSVITVTSISEDGIWLECEQGYFKIYNAIALINAMDRNPLVVTEDKKEENISTQPTEEKKALVDGSKSIVGRSNLTLEQIETLLAGTPMSGTGPAILEVEQKYNVNAFFTLAVAQCETQSGLTGTGASKKNPYGLTAKGGGYRSFSSYSEAILTFGDTLSRLYIPNGRTTVEKVNQIYCPGNSDWSNKVRTVMTKYLNKLT